MGGVYTGKCHASCLKCNGPSPNNCTTCNNAKNYYLAEGKNACYKKDKIPFNFYLDLNESIIRKCHPKCFTCNGEGTDENNNCIECNGGLELDEENNSNCVQKGCPKYCDECIEYYDNEIISIDKLCKRCSEDFYPLQKTSDEQFYVRCYPNDSSPNGYFFYEDGEKSEHRACYETCAKCNQTGDFSHHLCEECDTGFTKIEEEQDNCFPKCSFFYYYTIYKKYKCTEEKECPKEYPYLILKIINV